MPEDSTSNQRAKVTVYRTKPCPFCVAAEGLLTSHDVAFEEVFLDEHPDRRAFTASIKPGHHSVPLVVIDETPLGGFDDLQELVSSGGLDEAIGRS